jgi:YVTN family beta-propeller protein
MSKAAISISSALAMLLFLSFPPHVLASDGLVFTTEAVIPVGMSPQNIVVTPDGTRVYVSNVQSNTVSVISTSSNIVLADIVVGDNPNGLAITPDGHFLYVANFVSNTVSIIDIDPTNQTFHTVVGTISNASINGADELAVTPNGSMVFLTNQFGHLGVIDTPTKQLVSTITGRGRPDGLAVSPDGAKLYVATDGFSGVAPGIDIINVATQQLIASTIFEGPLAGSPGAVRFTPDGVKAYVTNRAAAPNGAVFVLDVSTDLILHTIEGLDFPMSMEVTPDGKWVFVAEQAGNRIAVIDVATDNIAQTISDIPSAAFVAIAPDAAHMYVSNVYDNTVTAIGIEKLPVYSCLGFEAPMDVETVTVKKNRALPLKAQLLDSDGTPITDLDIKAPPVIQITYKPETGEAVDVTDQAVPVGLGTDGNQFEFTGEQWQYNLNTTNFHAAGTYTIEIVSGDAYDISPSCTAKFLIK